MQTIPLTGGIPGSKTIKTKNLETTFSTYEIKLYENGIPITTLEHKQNMHFE